MPSFPVTVTASYDAADVPPDTQQRLEDWAAADDGRTFTVDASIQPVRWTATADFLVEAPDAHDAETTAVNRFLSDTARAGVAAPETVLGATGPFS